jgi:hypothetical protein
MYRKTRHSLLAATFLAAALLPALAPASYAAQDTKRLECMKAHLPDAVTAVQSHMKTYRQSKPQATREELSQERQNFMTAWRTQHPEEMQKARAACPAT